MSKDLIDNLEKSILECDSEKAVDFMEKAIKANISSAVLMDTLTNAIRIVGDNYEKGIIWLPDLMLASNTMESASKILKK